MCGAMFGAALCSCAMPRLELFCPVCYVLRSFVRSRLLISAVPCAPVWLRAALGSVVRVVSLDRCIHQLCLAFLL